MSDKEREEIISDFKDFMDKNRDKDFVNIKNLPKEWLEELEDEDFILN